MTTFPRPSGVLPTLLLLSLVACSDAAPAPEPPRRSGVLVTLDTTRVDMLGCYGGPPGVTPALDALATESLRFERAYATAPITLPSHASILTGLVPPRHTLRDNHLKPLPASAETLAERARDAGFETAAFVAAVVLDRAFGLDQGFERYDAPPRDWQRVEGVERNVERKADEVVDAALAWLDTRDPERPFFLWVHLFDPHMPHEAPAEFLERTAGRPYLAELAYTDAALGRLVDGLRSAGLLDETLLAVVADHGEALGDHGEPTHTITCYEATVRVPLLLRPPGGVSGGESVAGTVSTVDLFPTFVRALDLGAPGAVDGVDLLNSAPSATRGAYFESYVGFLNHGWSPLAGWVEGDLKLHASSAPELYDVVKDAPESRNLWSDEPARAEPHRRALRAIRARPALADDGTGTISESLRRDLRSLGYAAAAAEVDELPDPLAPSARPSPTEGLPEWRALLAASNEAYRGNVEAAIAGYRAILERNPKNLDARGRLLSAYITREEWADAERCARELLERGAARADTWKLLGFALMQQERHEEAAAACAAALELDRTDPETWRALERALTALGREDEAGAARETLEQLTRGEALPTDG